MSFTIAQITKATPCMPDNAVIPEFDNANIAPHIWRINQGDETLNPRRNFCNPVMFALGGARDMTTTNVKYKIECGKFLKRYADILRNKHLPLLSVYGVEDNVNDELGSFFEHSFPDFWVLYAELYDHSFKDVLRDHTRWLIKHEESGVFWKDNLDGKSSFRAYVRRIFELICLSETDINTDVNRDKCAGFATTALERIATMQSTSRMNSMGWDESRGLLYFHYNASIQRGERVDHTYFTAIFGGLMIRIKHSDYYRTNRVLVDKVFGLLVKTMTTIVAKTSETWNLNGHRVINGNISNIRHSELGLDSGKNGKYRSFSTDDAGKGKAGWPAYRLWPLCKTMDDFNKIIANTAVANLPGLMHYPEVITAYNDILQRSNTKQPPIQTPPVKTNGNIKAMLESIDRDTLKAAQYLGRARRTNKKLMDRIK